MEVGGGERRTGTQIRWPAFGALPCALHTQPSSTAWRDERRATSDERVKTHHRSQEIAICAMSAARALQGSGWHALLLSKAYAGDAGIWGGHFTQLGLPSAIGGIRANGKPPLPMESEPLCLLRCKFASASFAVWRCY